MCTRGYVLSAVLFLPMPRYAYKCVIYGWDSECKMSDAWVIQMGVDVLSRGKHQPFYNVLVEDGSNRYAAEGDRYKIYVD